MNWKLPNILTASRLPLAVAFFVLLGMYAPGATQANTAWLTAALVVFVAAGVTDFLDGHLARKMNLLSVFGRIVDPFVDKVLVIGSFVMLIGPNFSLTGSGCGQFEMDLPGWLTGGMVSAVQPWMVVVILAREFIVSAARGFSESQGKAFPATSAGKIKFFVQVVAIGTVLVQLAFVREAPWAVCVKVGMVWVAVIATIISGLAYVGRMQQLLVPDAGQTSE